MLVVTTESGSVYEIDNDRVRRVNTTAGKRGDGDWQSLIAMAPRRPEIGRPLVLEMKSLSRFGTDDHGTPPEYASDVTIRRTTPVTAIEHERLSSRPSKEES